MAFRGNKQSDRQIKGIIMSFKPISYKHRDKYVKIGWNIAYYRKAKGMTQLDLAEKAGISRDNDSTLQSAARHNFGSNTHAGLNRYSQSFSVKFFL